MKEERKALIDYRLEQADESLDSAQILFEHKKYDLPKLKNRITEKIIPLPVLI